MVKQYIKQSIEPTINCRIQPYKMGTLSMNHKDMIEKYLGRPNYTQYDDDKVGASWLFEDFKGDQYMIWRYKVAATYSVYGEKELLNKMFDNLILWSDERNRRSTIST